MAGTILQVSQSCMAVSVSFLYLVSALQPPSGVCNSRFFLPMEHTEGSKGAY